MNIEQILQAVKSRKLLPSEAARLISLSRSQQSSANGGGHGAQDDGLTLESIREMLISSFAKALYMERSEVKMDQSFVEMGLDSIVGVEWIKEINRQLQLELPATCIYDYPTIDLFADYLTSIQHVYRSRDKQLSTIEVGPVVPTRQAHLGGDSGLVVSGVHTLDEVSLSAWRIERPGAGEITVRVKASGINFPDVMCVNGLYPTMPAYPFVPGFEVAGVVVDRGEGVTQFDIGDEIIGLTGAKLGGHAHLVNLPEATAVKKPKDISFAQACSLPVAFGIVHYAFELANMRAGERVLIQTATGGCGLLAIQLARLNGAACIGTSSRDHKLQILQRLNVEHAINYKTPFDQTIKELTDGRGVDVVLNMLAGEAIQRGLNCLAPSGRYLEIAVHALKTSPKLSLSHLLQNQSFHSIDLRSLSLATGRGVKESLDAMVQLLEQGKIVPIVSRIYPFSKITEALEFVGRAQHIGKIVVSHECEQVKDLTEACIDGMLEQERRALKFRAEEESLIHSSSPRRRGSIRPLQMDSRLRGNDERGIDEGFPSTGPVAVIGLSGQFPKSASVEEFWRNISAGENCITEVSSSRWPVNEFYSTDSQAPGKTNCKWLGELSDADKFDPLFFSISPGEAQVMDPQQRLILQSSWSSIEDAGIDPSSLLGASCGVFVGVAPGDYIYESEESALNSNALMGRSMSILAARIAFFLNLKGPCITLDTACSSALVAVAEACNHLQLGTCKLALAGGVNVMAGPSLHIMTSKAGMLSSDGRCYTFDQRANGFVPAEAVGVVLLKRLADAQHDGDSIQAVIRGWGVNQDGKTNGITAPSAISQTQLETDVYRNFGIDPASITLMEAHGTGTKLGDPIEVRALTDAFRRFTDKRSYCALGSIKSNMGHAMAAAGIAGFIKVVLALRHKQLPPTINFEQLNEHVQVANTPFYINTSLKPWLVEEGMQRRAAVSSFGFSGTNAHVVVEEAPDHQSEESRARKTPLPCHLIALSARTHDQLKAQVAQLLGYLAEHAASDLGDISYTLLNGRKHFKCRLAAVVDSVDQLKQLLQKWQAVGRAEGILVSSSNENAREENKTLQKFAKQCLVDCASFGRAWRTTAVSSEAIEDYREKLAVLAESYIEGNAIEFGRLFDRKHCRPLSLPTYPFAKDRYWEDRSAASTSRSAMAAQSVMTTTVLHPLLQRNTSDLDEQRFSSTFSGEEFYLSDHMVGGNKVLPGVAYLEMARAAMERGSGLESGSRTVVTLKNVVWVRPLVVDAAKEVHIGLARGDNGEIEFEIYTAAEPSDPLSDESGRGNEVIHAQGRAMATAAEEAEHIDLSSLRSRCNQSIDVAQCYATFSSAGLAYGPAHRALTSVQVGSDAEGQRFVLAEVKLPACVSEASSQYVVHPSVLDCALQASIGFSLADIAESDATARPTLPFALEKLQVFDRSPANAVVVMRPSAARAAGNLQKLDLDICDESGRVCVRLLGFTSRVLESGLDDQGLQKQTLLFIPTWSAKLLMESLEAPPDYGERWVWLDSIYKECVSGLEARCPLVKWAVLPGEADSDASAKRVISAGEQLFACAQKILQSKPKQAVLLQVVIGTDSEGVEVASALSALLKSAHQENPKLVGQVIELPRGATATELLAVVEGNASEGARSDQRIRYVGGAREVVDFKEHVNTRAPQSLLPWKDRGVYLITGGAGGLGLIFAREIASRVQGARIILTGRSEASATKQAQLDTLNQEANGARVEYRMLDVNDAAAVVRCIHSLVEQYGALNGIIHSAGVTKDNFIYKKTAEEFSSVLEPKVSGTINLDHATRDIELDFLILFSSTAGVFGNVGQSDYAMANAFMDCYAAYRNERVKNQQRHGRTLSVNWPLWADGGMQVDAAVLEQVRRQGLDVLPTAEGVGALHAAWASHEPQVLVLKGEQRRLRSLVGAHQTDKVQAPIATVAAAPATPIDTTGLLEKVRRLLIQLISQQLKVKEEDIDVRSELSEFGFDSISLTAFGNTLNQVYGLELSPTIFFEYPTVQRFAEHLATEHSALLAEKLGVRAAKSTSSIQASASPSPLSPANKTKRRRRRSTQIATATQEPEQASGPEPIAIIGMSGCFPGATDLDAFWENLRAGKDGISEIPQSRWDWRAFYGDPTREANKTNIKWGGFIEGVDEFDPLFFNISPREATAMDPQQRLLMTYTWRAIEDAGYAAQSLSGSKTAIFVGTASSGYSELVAQAGTSIEGHDSTGGSPSLGPNRMSYLLNLHGPSEPIETACSSSLVAIHRAVRAMQSGDCEQALVGGINTIITPWTHISFSKAGMLCEDGRCKTFSKDANGYVRGEGVGMLFLKKLDAAERDGDHIYGLIRGSSENHGGRANSLTAPNPKAQTELIKAAYREAKIDPRTVSYIETHGTGTPLGDPIEINGLKSAFTDLYADHDAGRVAEAHCGLGSVKTNVGHLELAAGVVGVIKVLLQLKHKTLVKSLHCEQINPYIDLNDSPFYLVTQTQPWQARLSAEGRVLPRRAGVSSFGFGGANAHVVIEEYCATDPAQSSAITVTPEHPALIVLSAKSEERLLEQAKQLLAHIADHPYAAEDLAHIAYTLQVGREEMDHRLAFTAITIADLKAKLSGYVEGNGTITECCRGEVRKNRDALSALNTDEDASELVRTWLEKGKYTKLLELWVKGLVFDWTQLYIDRKPLRLSLPTYPFARERYWIDAGDGSRAEQKPQVSTPPFDNSRCLKVTERWTAQPLEIREQAWPTMVHEKGAQRVLVLCRQPADAEGFEKALARILGGNASRLSVDVARVPELSASKDIGPLDEYLQEHRAPDAVFYFSGVIEDHSLIGSELRCILQTSQRLIERAGDKAVQFHYCYPSSEAVTTLYQEGLSGLFRAIAVECPAHCYRSIEYPSSASLQDYVSIVREWLQHSATDLIPAQLPMVRYREGARYVTALTELAESESTEKPIQFRRGATYLMVGALGEVGQLVCRALARSYGPRLVILSRRAPDADVRRRLAEIVDAGAEVLYRSVDITDENQLAEALSGIKSEVGAIEGVFHFARSVCDGPLLSKDIASFQRTIAAKVAGTLNIDKLTADEPLEFFIVFSSMAAFGIAGSADYGYATAFQNAFVRARNRKCLAKERQGASIAFCWGQWAADAYSNKERDAALGKMGFDFIDASFALHTMAATLRGEPTAEVLGAIAVNNKLQVKQLYGLTTDGGRSGLKPKVAYRVEQPTEMIDDDFSLDDLVALNEELSGDDDAMKAALLGRSYDQLSRLYQSLADQ